MSFPQIRSKRFNNPLANPVAAGGPNNYTQTFTASLSFVGNENALTFRALVAAAVSFVGSIAKKTLIPLTGGLSFTTLFVGGGPVYVVLTAALSFVGNINKATAYPLAAAVSFVGSTLKQTTKGAFTAAVSFVGSFLTGALHKLTLVSAALSFSGAFSKQTGKSISGSLSFSGSIPARAIAHVLAGAVSFTTFFLNGNPITMILTASLSFVGTLPKRTSVPLAGALSFVGSIGKRIGKALAAAASFVGSFASSQSHGGAHYQMVFTASVSFVGHIPYSAGALPLILLTDGRLAKWLGGILYLPL